MMGENDCLTIQGRNNQNLSGTTKRIIFPITIRMRYNYVCSPAKPRHQRNCLAVLRTKNPADLVCIYR